LAADGAEMRAVGVPENLNAVVAIVADDEVALGVKRDVAQVSRKLAIAAALATNAPHVRAVPESEHLHTRVVRIEHGY